MPIPRQEQTKKAISVENISCVIELCPESLEVITKKSVHISGYHGQYKTARSLSDTLSSRTNSAEDSFYHSAAGKEAGGLVSLLQSVFAALLSRG